MARFGVVDNAIYQRGSRSAEALKEIEFSNAATLPLPKDGMDPKEARITAADDLAALRLINNEEHRKAALLAIGHTASVQREYRAEIQRDAPAVAAAAALELDQDKREWDRLPGVHVADPSTEPVSPRASNQSRADVTDKRPVAERMISPGNEGVSASPESKTPEARGVFRSPPQAPEPDAPPDNRRAIPASIAQRYVQVENKFYGHDKKLAFVDSTVKLKAETNSIDVVRSLVEIAEARGWEAMAVTGTKDFRRQVWREAAMRGIEANGYQPSDLERAELKAALEKRHGPNEIQQQARAPSQQRNAPAEPSKTAPAAAQSSTPRDPPVPKEYGLESHGRWVNRVNEENAAFLRESDERMARINAKLAAKTQSKEAVSSERPDTVAEQATLKAAELFALERIRPENRAAFVEQVRKTLDAAIAKGQTIQAPKIRERASEKEPAREQPELVRA